MVVFKKGMKHPPPPKKKKNKLFSRTKLKPVYQTKFFLVETTNSVLQT